MTDRLIGIYKRIYRSPSNLNLQGEANFTYHLKKHNTNVSLSLSPYSGPDVEIGPGKMNAKTIFEIEIEVNAELNEMENDDKQNIEDILKVQLSSIADAFACTTLINLHPQFVQESSQEYVKFSTPSGEMSYLSVKGGVGTVSVSQTLSLQDIEKSYNSLVMSLERSLLTESNISYKLFLSSLEARYTLEKFLLGYAAFEGVINSLHKNINDVNTLHDNYDQLISVVASVEDTNLKDRLNKYLSSKKYSMVNPAIREKFQSIVKHYHSDDNEIRIFGKIGKIRNAILHGRQADIPGVPIFTNQDFTLDEDNPILSLWYLYKKYSNLIIELNATS